MVDGLKMMEKKHTEMAGRFGLESEKLGDMEQSLKQNIDTISKNIESLESRIGALGK